MLKHKTIRQTTSYGLPEMILFVGVLLAIMGGLNFVSTFSDALSSPSSTGISSTVIERKLAIEQAQREGKNTYVFKTNFIPGIGVITNPEAFKASLKKAQD